MHQGQVVIWATRAACIFRGLSSPGLPAQLQRVRCVCGQSVKQARRRRLQKAALGCYPIIISINFIITVTFCVIASLTWSSAPGSPGKLQTGAAATAHRAGLGGQRAVRRQRKTTCRIKPRITPPSHGRPLALMHVQLGSQPQSTWEKLQNAGPPHSAHACSR